MIELAKQDSVRAKSENISRDNLTFDCRDRLISWTT
jgi:hypothetical protein